jgi:hypothetical protein
VAFDYHECKDFVSSFFWSRPNIAELEFSFPRRSWNPVTSPNILYYNSCSYILPIVPVSNINLMYLNELILT